MEVFSDLVLITVVVAILGQNGQSSLLQSASAASDPTAGFHEVKLSEHNFKIQRPYDVPISKRYSFKDGVRKLWVYGNDKGHSPGNRTPPRTEIRIQGLDYHTGAWQMEAEVYVPKGTSGASLMQVHGGKGVSSTVMVRIYDGDLRYYSGTVLAHDMYDKWFKMNMIHDADNQKVAVYVDGKEVFRHDARGKAPDFYFKCGVYTAPKDHSRYMESRWRNIKMYKK
ncbi:Citrate-binding protein [Linum grandiflorum]